MIRSGAVATLTRVTGSIATASSPTSCAPAVRPSTTATTATRAATIEELTLEWMPNTASVRIPTGRRSCPAVSSLRTNLRANHPCVIAAPKVATT